MLCDELRRRGLYISVSPDLEVTEAPVHGAWYRKVQGHHVVAVSDGSATRTAVGCAVVFCAVRSGVTGVSRILMPKWQNGLGNYWQFTRLGKLERPSACSWQTARVQQ